MNKTQLKNLIREELGKILHEELESAETVAGKINNVFRANAEVKNVGGTDFIVFPNRKGPLPSGGFSIDDLKKLSMILSTYPKSTLGTHSEVPGIVSIKIIK